MFYKATAFISFLRWGSGFLFFIEINSSTAFLEVKKESFL